VRKLWVFFLLLQNQELRHCNFTFYKKETEIEEQQKPSLYEGWLEGYGLCLQLAYLYWSVAGSNASLLVFYGSSQLFSIALSNFYHDLP
jgi:hypothetical protein